MKKLIIIAIAFICGLSSDFSTVSAQNDVSVSVCVGEQRLADLLTEEQKNNVTHLTITGTMTEEDYAFIRTNRLKRIVELNLRDADIETLPEHAFDFEWGDSYDGNGRKVILPPSLKHVSDYGLCVRRNYCDFVLTGKFPTLGKNVYCSDIVDDSHVRRASVTSESGNGFIKQQDGVLLSPDGTILYFVPYYDGFVVPQGTKIIYGNAFEGMHPLLIDLPEEIDSIGSRAFANLKWNALTCMYCDPLGYMICRASTPPKLGEDVFNEDIYNSVHVPDESVEMYETTEGWNKCFISGLSYGGINQPRTDSENLSVKKVGDNIKLKSSKRMDNIKCYAADGQMIHEMTVHDTETTLDCRILKTMSLVRVKFEDGTNETVKLKP